MLAAPHRDEAEPRRSAALILDVRFRREQVRAGFARGRSGGRARVDFAPSVERLMSRGMPRVHASAVVADYGVVVPVHLQHGDGSPSAAKGIVRSRPGTGHAHDGRYSALGFAGPAMRHEAAVRNADGVNATPVDGMAAGDV